MSHKIHKVLQLFGNAVLNKIPSRHLRIYFYRCLGASIGRSIIFRNTEILDPQFLTIGDYCSIGWHCLIDSRGIIKIGNNVNISSYVKIISQGHDYNSKHFDVISNPIIIEDFVWLATGCTILQGVHIGKGAVVASGAVVTKDVPPYTVVGGIPAKKIAERTRDLDYRVALPPYLY